MLKKMMALVLCGMVLTAAGCGGREDKQSSDRKAKGEIVVSMGKYMISGGYDPTAGWGTWASDPFHSALLTHDKDNKLVNDLATEMKVSPDGLHYTFTLRTDAKFSDGQPLTAEAVAFTFTTAKKAAGAVDLTFMDSVRAVDDSHVEFILNRPWSVFPETVASVGIVAPYAYGKDYGSKPVGSGPWKLISFQKEQQMILVPNEYYYGPKPKLKKITVVNIGDDAALAAAQSGQVDILFMPPEFVKNEVQGMKLLDIPTIDSFAINLPMDSERQEKGMTVGNNVTSDPAIRQALNIGISRQEIIKNALNGFGTPIFTFSKNLQWAAKDLDIKDGQVEEAKAILEKAGWKDTDGDGIREKNGLKAEFTVNGRSNDQARYNTAVAVAAEAKKLGIRINAKSTAWSEARKVARHDPTVWSFGDYSAQTFYNYFHSSQIGVNVINNPAMYHNPKVDSLIEAALGAKSVEEADSLFRMAQSDYVKNDIPYLWIADCHLTYFVNDKLDLGTIRVGERGQGMGLAYNMSEWQWK